jgi:hypothetical protein
MLLTLESIFAMDLLLSLFCCIVSIKGNSYSLPAFGIERPRFYLYRSHWWEKGDRLDVVEGKRYPHLIYYYNFCPTVLST